MRKSMISKLVGIIFATAFVAIAVAAWAQDVDGYAGGYRPYGMGPGMMGGGGYGYGMGPGMMGGGCGGMGMMGGMMGSGMMGGYGGMGMMGMGPGMMSGGMMGGGYGMGPGMMMGYGAPSGLDLSGEQRTKIDKIFDAERKQHWSVMGKMMDEQNKLRDLYAQETPDPKKVGAVYGKIAKLRQQMIETHVQASNQAQQVLTKEQREQLRQWNRGGWGWGPRGPAAGQPGAAGPGMMR